MNKGFRLLVYPVKDVAQATALYGKLLGTEPYIAEPYYVGFKVGDMEVGLDPNGHSSGLNGPLAYLDVSDIKQSLQSMLDAGAQLLKAVTDVGGGMLITWIKDGSGNIIGLRQAP
jgi:predicted enzyme related to lactoylglutathione lyase